MKKLENKKFSENLNISENTKKEIENSNKLENEGLNVEDNSTTKSNKSNCDNSKVKEESKIKKLKKLLDNKTGLFFEGSEKYKNFMTSFGALKNVDSNAFEGALKAVKKSWEDENKEELEKLEQIDAVDFFKNILKDKEIKELIDSVYLCEFNCDNIVKEGYVICYISNPNKKENNNNNDDDKKANYNTGTIKLKDFFGKTYQQVTYYKKLDNTRSNYIKAIKGYVNYFDALKRVKNEVNKANAVFNDLQNILIKIKNAGGSLDKVLDKVNDTVNYIFE